MNGLDGFLLELAARSGQEAEPEDYTSGGLLHCGKCGTPKQCWIEIDGMSMLVGCMCRCAEEAWQAEQKALRAAEEALRVQNLRVQGIQDRAMHGYTFECAEESPNIAKCREYVRRWPEMRRENIGLLLAGPPGTGKTFAAACIANALISKGVPVLMTSFPRILNSGDFDKTGLTREMKEFGLLVIDDLGTERRDRDGRASGYAQEIMELVVDERYKSQKPLIVTTNLSKAQMDDRTDINNWRIFERLEEMCQPLFFGGPSRRKQKAEHKRRIIREVFG